MRKSLTVILVTLSVVALMSNSVSYFNVQQNTYLVVGFVLLECVVSGKDVVVFLKNTRDKEFIISSIEVAPNMTAGVALPQLLRPKSAAYLTLEDAGESNRIYVFLKDPETNTSLVMSCAP